MDYAEFDSEHAPYDGLRKFFLKQVKTAKTLVSL